MSFKKRIYKEGLTFISTLFEKIERKGVLVENYYMDHLCFRVESVEEYLYFKKELESFSTLLIESVVGGRNISTFKLEEPIIGHGREVNLIELPEPKSNNSYLTGFEHAEFVISESFVDFSEKYSSHEFDWSGAKKSFNPELRLVLEEGISAKFHHMSLEDVIKIEINEIN